MSAYKGQLPEKAVIADKDIKVTVDGQPLPPDRAEVPTTGQAFGWGTASTWTGRKLLAFSMLFHNCMDLPNSVVHSYLIDIADLFMEDQIAKLEKNWTMTSEDIGQWIKVKCPKVWADLMSRQTPA